MDGLNESYEIIFINDGSRDRTGEMLLKICESDYNTKLIDFARNFGHQIAITAGMDYAAGDCMVIIDGICRPSGTHPGHDGTLAPGL